MIDSTAALDEGQLHFFKTFGYVVLRNLLKADDLATIGRELDEGLEVQYPHKPFDGTKRQWTRMTDEVTPQ